MRKLSEGNAWIMMRPLLFAVCVVFMFALSGPSAQVRWIHFARQSLLFHEEMIRSSHRIGPN